MLEILFEDNHCLALNKPAGLLTQGDATGEPNQLDEAKENLRTRYQKPGNVFLGLLHRLDRPVSGAILFAKTSKAAERISRQFRDGSIRKVYWAIVEGRPPGESGEWIDILKKDEAKNVVSVVSASTPGGREARLAFRILERRGGQTLLELRPFTGRSHQLRVQLASRGLPIVGDRKYGARSILRAADGGSRIALHAREMAFTHPTRQEVISIVAPVPADWPGGWTGS
jgi:23S rRNA pseudouridine1911/1915/1917 synthase